MWAWTTGGRDLLAASPRLPLSLGFGTTGRTRTNLTGSKTADGLDLVALLGAGETEVVVLAELHRNPRVHVVGIHDPRPEAVGHDLAEILGLRHGSGPEFLEQIAAAPVVVLPRDVHSFSEEIEFLRARDCELIDHDEALARYAAKPQVEAPLRPELLRPVRHEVGQLEESLRWLERAMDREVLLRSLLSIAVQAVGADKGSIQLFDPFTQQLYIAYADGLSDHTVRASRQCLGEGIAGRVASTRRAELLHGQTGRPADRDRPDIQSAISTPLEDDGELLGVLNVSTDHGSRHLSEADLDRLATIADRIAPVLRRLLQIQGLFDRALVEDLERELESVLALDPPIPEGLALIRDLVQDLSGAYSGELVLLAPDGPAARLHPGRDDEGRARVTRDIDPSQGILGQVLLDTSPVLLEEKNRRAGEHHVRREMTLYLPLGGVEAYGALILRFEGLSALGHFQRNLDRVRDILGPRIGLLLSRSESRQRHERLRRLASGLSRLANLDLDERTRVAATLFMELSGAEAVALWRGGSELPDCELRRSQAGLGALDRVWERLRERARRSDRLRARELDPAGSELRSVLLVGEEDGPLLAALNRRPEDVLAEWGFRDEDLEAAELLLEAVARAAAGETPPPATRATVDVADLVPDAATARRLLLEAVAREMRRSQRYHLGFSLNLFTISTPADTLDPVAEALREHVERSSRSSDALFWLDARRLAILAPEELRGQRQLVRRMRQLVCDFLAEHLGPEAVRVEVRSAAYPRDVSEAAAMVDHCLGPAPSAGD